MRRFFVVLWCSTLAAANTADLRRLADENRFFELRQALEESGSSDAGFLFFRGAVASRFGHEAEGIELLRKFVATQPAPEMCRRAYEELGGAYERAGRYRNAAEAWAEALALTPANDRRRDTANTRALMAAMGDVPPQTIGFAGDEPSRAVRNKLGSWDVPVEVNGIAGNWIFDTGANLSTLAESEARRMGLAIRESGAWVGGSTGAKNNLRLAMAAELRLGAARMRNVVFLVLRDESLHIAPLHYQISGILGLPVLRALTRVGIARDGTVRINGGGIASANTPNLFFFDEQSPIVEITHNQSPFRMFLDTGANSSVLYPASARALNREETSALRNRREKTAGAGGMLRIETRVLPLFHITIADAPVTIKKVSILSEIPGGDDHHRDGVIGMDALWNGFVLDFKAMRLEVQ